MVWRDEEFLTKPETNHSYVRVSLRSAGNKATDFWNAARISAALPSCSLPIIYT